MMKRFLLKLQKKVQEPTRRRNLLRTMRKVKGKCCKLIIYNSSTHNLDIYKDGGKVWIM